MKFNIDSSSSKLLILLLFLAGLSNGALSQSPKKLLKNGFYEQAFVNAVHKQNKKVKLKKKHIEVIYPSYDIIYQKQNAIVQSPEYNWQQSYEAFIRLAKFRNRVTHPGIFENLKNVLYETATLDILGNKSNQLNQKDAKSAEKLELSGNYSQALSLYENIQKRQNDLLSFSALAERINPIDCVAKIDHINKSIGDSYIREAKTLLDYATKPQALSAIELIKKAERYRPLSFEEQELITLANLIIGESWIDEAQKLMQTKTKRNARLAFELISRASTVRVLTTDEEKLKETAKDLGTTRVLVKVNGENAMHDAQYLSGVLNKRKNSQWLSYYHVNNNSVKIDYSLDISETQPTVAIGDMRKKISQSNKQVEYYEEQVDSTGKVTRVKKTRTAVAMIATLSRTKTAQLKWSVVLNSLSDGKAEYSEIRNTKLESKNEYVSLESGDILALPDNVETGVDLDSQPFPTDKDMLAQVTQKYLSELISYVNSKKDHLRNINVPLEK